MLSAEAKLILKETANARNRRILRSDMLASIEYEAGFLVFEKRLTEQAVDKALQEIDREVLSGIVDQVRTLLKDCSQ